MTEVEREIVQRHRRGMREKIAQRDSSSNWPVHVALVIWAIVAVSLEHWFSGWGVPIGIGGLVVGLGLKLLFIFPFAVVDFLVFGIVVQCVALLCSRDPALH